MPEGDTIFRAARTLDRALAGKTVARFESMFPALNRIDQDRPLAGRTVISVRSRGKHLLMTFSGDLVLHTHMRMNGSWHIYRPQERWRRPSGDMRIVVAVHDLIAVGFNIPVAEFLSSSTLARHRQLAALGQDVADADFDRHEVLRRLRDRAAMPIGDALLDQRVLSGIGNVLKSEILFVTGIDPFTPVGRLSEPALGSVLDVSRRLMKMNVVESEVLGPSIGRRTTGSLDPFQKLWVYGRGGKPCRKCGATVRAAKTGPDARLTYWCPACQRAPGGDAAVIG
jgi:endonuclease-8